MENKKYLLLTISTIFVLVLAGFSVYILAFGEKDKEPETEDVVPDVDDSQGNTGGMDENDFTLSYEYVGNNTWNYNVSGFLPNPCYSAIVSEIVRESFPEQVSVSIDVNYDSESICTQQLIDFDYDGEFFASEGASVDLMVF